MLQLRLWHEWALDMTLWTEVARHRTESGDQIILRQRGNVFEIRFNGLELMSNLNHQSETMLAERSARLYGRPARRVFIGGLGMGFTLRTMLDWLELDGKVTVCELVPEIIEWNRRHFGHLAGHPLNDRRVELRVGDVLDVLREAGGSYEMILMDTDNGPDYTVRETNGAIYENPGLRSVWNRLAAGGLAAFWSATISDEFEERLDQLPWRWHREDICLDGGRADAFHHIYFATKPAADAASEVAAEDALEPID